MTPVEIKELRKFLGLTQDEFSTLLGVTKTTAARYEMEKGSKPQGDAEKKLVQLLALTSSEEGKKQILEIKEKGGIASLSAILSIGVASFTGISTLEKISLPAILSTPAALFLGIGAVGVIASFFKNKK